MANKKLIAARVQKFLTQEELAEQVGVTFVTISRWENGLQQPRAYAVRKLCQVFHTSPEGLGLNIEPDEDITEQRQEVNTHIQRKNRTFVPSLANTGGSLMETRRGAGYTTNTTEPFPPTHSSGTPVEKSNATWFLLKQQSIQLLVDQWSGRAMYCDELQGIIDQELRMFDLVKSLYHQETYTVSRRSVLTALACLPLTLLASSPQKLMQPPHPEVFLPECTASITACWSLLNGDGLATIEQTLPAYLPTLVAWSKQPSRYQSTAASLGAQGSLLMHLVSYHRFHFQDALAYANQAVELATTSGDHDLLIYALIYAGAASKWNGEPHLELQKLQEAESLLPKTIQPLQSYVLAQLADAYAQNSYITEAQSAISKARDLFPEDFRGAPCYVSADYDYSQLIILEGQTHLTLGIKDADQALTHYKHAKSALGVIDHLPPGTMIPQRNRAQIINCQAQAAIGVGDLDEAEHYLLAGLQGATALGSEKRRQEVLANWQAANKRWPQEKRVIALAESMLS